MEGPIIFEEPKAWKRAKLLAQVIGIMCGLALCLFISFCLLSVRKANSLNQESKDFFFDRRPDLIAVFTGDAGRIQYALEKSVELKQPNLFITGVYSKNTVKTIIKALGISQEINTMHLELDYQAQNTLENVIFTYRYLLTRKDLKSILIVSHDYHIPRIKMIIDKLKGKDQEREFFYLGVETSYTTWRNFKLLAKEVIKELRTKVLLWLWDPTIEEPEAKGFQP